MQYLKCTINEQDGTSENETDMFLELPDMVTEDDQENMLRAFLLDWYSDGEWEDEKNMVVWFPCVGKSVALTTSPIKTKAEWDVLVKYTHNSTAKFLYHLPNRKNYMGEYKGKYCGKFS